MSAPNALARFGSLSVTGADRVSAKASSLPLWSRQAKVAFIDIAIDASRALCERLSLAGHDEPLWLECRNAVAALSSTLVPSAGTFPTGFGRDGNGDAAGTSNLMKGIFQLYSFWTGTT